MSLSSMIFWGQLWLLESTAMALIYYLYNLLFISYIYFLPYTKCMLWHHHKNRVRSSLHKQQSCWETWLWTAPLHRELHKMDCFSVTLSQSPILYIN